MIRELEAEGLAGDDLVKAVAEELGVTEDRARFLIALEHGEVDGNVVDVEKRGES